MIRELYVERYRSLKRVRVSLSAINVIVGPNGSGKTNLYRALKLLPDAAAGRLARTLVDEGGMPSIEFAGARERGTKAQVEVRATLDDVVMSLRFGVVPPDKKTRFTFDPELKAEHVARVSGGRMLVERKGQSAWLTDVDGARVKYPAQLSPSESVLAQLKERHRYPEAATLVDRLSTWRFHHDLRTDAHAPARAPQVATRTHRLDDEGRDVAAVLQTIREIGDEPALDTAIEDAFPGARLVIEGEQSALAVGLRMPGLARPLSARELSDGTLRYVLLVAALLAPRAAEVVAFNEPEASLHPSLLRPLARMLVAVSSTSQVIVTTHSAELAEAVAAEGKGAARLVEVALVDGETRLTTSAPELDTIDLLG